MSRKTKINVLLPIKMVGELERLSKLGKRSEFIQKAIRSRLNNQDNFDLWDVDDKDIMKMARAIAWKNKDTVLHTILQNRLEGEE